MLPAKAFSEFVKENTELTSEELAHKISKVSPEMATFLGSYFIIMQLPTGLNKAIIMIVGATIDFMRYKLLESLEPKEN